MKSSLKSSVAWAAAIALVCPVLNLVVAQDGVPQANESKAPTSAAKPAVSVPGCTCCTAGGAPRTSPIILALDIDKDGQISAAEIRNASVSLSALDVDGDGNLNSHEMHAQSEFPVVSATRQSKLMLGVTRDFYAQTMLLRDANQNGQLEMEEMNGQTLVILHLIDTNDDQILSYEELRDINKPKPAPLTQPNDKKLRSKAPNLRSTR